MSANLDLGLEAINQSTSKIDSCKIIFNQLEAEVDKKNLIEVLSDLYATYNLILDFVNFAHSVSCIFAFNL